MWNYWILSLIGKFAAIHFFVDNPAFDREVILLLPLMLKAIEK